MAEQEKIVETNADEQTKEALQGDSEEKEKLIAQIKALEKERDTYKKERDEANAIVRETQVNNVEEVLEFDKIFNGDADK